MATAQRTYLVTGNGQQRIVIASNQAQAIRHVVDQEYKAEVADGLQVAKLTAAGVPVEQARINPENKELFGDDLGA